MDGRIVMLHQQIQQLTDERDALRLTMAEHNLRLQKADRPRSTAKKIINKAGVGRMEVVAHMYGCTPNNLHAMAKSNPLRLEIFALGCKVMRDRQLSKA